MRRHPSSTPRPRHSQPRLMARLMARTVHLALAVLVATTVGCHDGDDDCDQCGPVPPPVYVELEPNDSPLAPDRIGVVDAYSLLYVDGHVEAVPGIDIIDHIEFFSATRAVYDFRIDALSAYGDVDVTVYDPVADVVVGVFAVSGSVEFGRVVVHEANRPFQLIIEAYQYDTSWSLELVGDFYSGYLASTAGAGAGGFSRLDTSDEPAGLGDGQERSVEPDERAKVSPIEALLVPIDELR